MMQKMKVVFQRIKITVVALLLVSFVQPFMLSASAEDDIYHQYIRKRAEMLNALGDYQTWPIERKAELDQVLIDGDYFARLSDSVVNVRPTEDDLPMESAKEIAAAAIAEEFAVDQALVETWHVDYAFWELTSGRRWMLLFTEEKAGAGHTYDVYRVEIESPSGEVVACFQEEHGAGEAIGGTEKEPDYVAVGKEAAIDIARTYLRENVAEAHRLTDEIISAFSVGAGYVSEGDETGLWLVSFVPSDPVLYEYFGSICITVSADTGEVMEIDDSSNG